MRRIVGAPQFREYKLKEWKCDDITKKQLLNYVKLVNLKQVMVKSFWTVQRDTVFGIELTPPWDS